MPQFSIGEVILNGKYRIEKLLGEGAFGEVYLATHLNLKAPRALKVLRKEGESGVGSTIYGNARRRFLQESKLGAQLGSHPHIIQVMDFDEVDDLMMLALEYAPGGSLRDRLESLREQGQLLPIAEALRIASETADGLSALHSLDVVHRDLKPGNILFDKQGHAKVADFGLAQVPHGESQRSVFSQPEPHPGTPGYMSPEQKTPPYDVLTPASDIYALGAVLFEMLTGRSQYMQRLGTCPSELRPGVPVGLDELEMRMLSKDPQERPFDGAEAARLLRDAELPHQVDSTAAPRAAPREPTLAGLVECPICGSYNELKDTFRCKGCGRAQLCRDHRDKATYLCEDCERVRKAAEEKARLEAAERERKAAEEKARQEAAERERKAAEEKARQEATERVRKAAEEKARQEATERVRKAAEEKARLEAEERARKFRREGDRLWVKLAQGVEMEFVHVPAGEFTMGSNEGSAEKPVHEVHLDEYWMGRYPVTNVQYTAFVKASGRSGPPHWGKDGAIPLGFENHPVVYVSWEDAVAFCAWLSRESGQKIGLPTEAQWEKAARGTAGRTYPWGNEAPDPKRCNFGMQVKNTTPVGQYSPQDDGPYSCADMAGNVWEWVADWYGPYTSGEQSNPSGPAIGTYRVLRGGSWYVNEVFVRSSIRFNNSPNLRVNDVGFRCSRSLSGS